MAKENQTKIAISAPQPLLALLQTVARQARTHTARHLADTGLYAGQENIIQLLAEHDSLTPSQIAQALGVRPPTITKSITRLVEQGFVARASGHADGRIVQIQLTEAGNSILNDAAKAVRKADKQALKALGDGEAKQLRVLVEKLSETLAKRDSKALKQTAKKHIG